MATPNSSADSEGDIPLDDPLAPSEWHDFEEEQSDGTSRLDHYTVDFDEARKEVVNMIIVHEYPLSMVDAFREFFANLNPLFNLPSRETVRSDILEIYKEDKLKTRRMIEKTGSRIAITVARRESYNPKKWNMALTAHFIDRSWTLQRRIIRCCHVPFPQTKEVIAEELMNIFLELNLDIKLSTITLDSHSDNGVVDLLVDKISPNCLLVDGTLFQMCCCARVLDSIVKDGLLVIGDAVDRIRDSVDFWTASPERREKFEDSARELCVPTSKRLRLDCKTKWISTYSMLEIALFYKDVFVPAKLTDPLCKMSPTEDDWNMTKVILEKLQIFHSLAKTFSRTKYPTANFYFPMICDIKLALTEWISDSNVTIARMASRMLEKFEVYWSVIHGILGVATVLDPRYKKHMLEYKFSKIYGLTCAAEIERIDNICRNLLQEYKKKFEDSGLVSETSDIPERITQDVDMQKYYEYIRKKRSRITQVRTEFDYYLEEDVSPLRPDFDILEWWKTKGLKYPMLRRIARDIYAIPMFALASKPTFHSSLVRRFSNEELKEAWMG